MFLVKNKANEATQHLDKQINNGGNICNMIVL